MIQHIVEQSQATPAQITTTPNVEQQRQLDRLEQQKSAIMSVLNKLNVTQSGQIPPQAEQEKQKGLFGKFFK